MSINCFLWTRIQNTHQNVLWAFVPFRNKTRKIKIEGGIGIVEAAEASALIHLEIKFCLKNCDLLKLKVALCRFLRL